MKLLAIDPSMDKHAWVLWDTEAHDFFGARCGLDLWDDLPDIDESGVVDMLAIEFPQNYGINAGKSIMLTCFQAGRIVEALMQRYTEFALFGRPTIKGQIGGRTDSEVACSLRMRHGEAKKGHKLEGVRKDIWAALALAVALDENPKLNRISC